MRFAGLFVVLVGLHGFAGLPILDRVSIDYSADAGGAASSVELFSTFDGRPFPAYVIACQKFTDQVLEGLTVYAADDFVVPGSVTEWVVDEVQVFGSYFFGPGSAHHVSVYFFAHDGVSELPDTEDPASAFYRAEALPYIDRGFGDFTIDLPDGGVALPPGRYWLAVLPTMAAGIEGQWGWTESSAVPDTGQLVGFESSWFQTTAPIQIPNGECLDFWQRRITDCNQTDGGATTPLEYDLAFRLGRKLVSSDAFTRGPLLVDEGGSSITFEIALAEQPTADVTLGLQSSNPGEGILAELTEGGMVPLEGSLNLLFTDSDWHIPRKLVLIGQPDSILDGDTTFAISFDPMISADPVYSGIKPRDLVAINSEISCFGGQVTSTDDSGAPTVDDRICFRW